MKKLIFFFVFSILLIGFVSATWYLPWTWFQDPINNTEQEGKLFIIDGGQEWNAVKAVGEESNLTFSTVNQKDKKTSICWTLQQGKTLSDTSDRFLYNEDNNLILDDKDKEITLKWENSAQCGGLGFHIDLTNAQAINIDEYIKLGEQSFVIEYQNQSTLSYDLSFGQANVTLFKNISNSWNNTINDLFVYYNNDSYKFGATDNSSENGTLNSYKYQIKSNIQIYENNFIPYIRNPVRIMTPSHSFYETHEFDFSDICNREDENITANCSFDYSSELIIYNETYNYTNYILEVTFVSNFFIDPTISISSDDWITTSLFTNVTVESDDTNFTHLTIDNTTAPYTNLVGYWNFDADNINSYLNTSYDFSSNNRDGTMVSEAHVNTTDCLESFGNCARFEGVNDWIITPTIALANWPGITAMAWVRWSELIDNEQSIISNYNPNDPYFKLQLEPGCSNCIEVVIGSIGDNTTGHEFTDTVVNYDEWTHVAFNYNLTDSRVWVNGVESGELGDHDGLDASASPVGVYIGVDGASAGEDFNGTIDEVMLFNVTLTAAQIIDIYNNNSARFKRPGTQRVRASNITDTTTWNDEGFNRVNLTVTTQENLSSNIEGRMGQINMSVDPSDLVLYMPFEWGSAVDISGKGNDGTLAGEMKFDEDEGLNGTGVFYFNVSAGTYIDMGDSQSLNLSDEDFTIALWLNTSNQTTSQFISEKKEAFNEGFYLQTQSADGEIHWEIEDLDSRVRIQGAGTDVVDGTWHHIVANRNATAISVYVDGVLDASLSTAGIDSIDAVGQNLFIGYDSQTQLTFDGLMDNIIILKGKALELPEVQALFNNQSLAHNIPYYTAYQDIVSDGNNTFVISKNADFVFPEYRFTPGNTTDNPFYSPILLGDINGLISAYSVQEDIRGTSKGLVKNVTLEYNDNNHSHLTINNQTEPYNNLVGYWNFDGDNVNAKLNKSYDWTMGNDGTMAGDAVSNGTGCLANFGNCLQLEGDSDYVNIGYPSDLEGMTELSVSMWVYHASLTDDDDILVKGTHNTNQPFVFWMDNDGTDHYSLIITDSNGDTTGAIETSAVPDLQKWTHIGIVFTGDDDTTIYINGVEDGSFPVDTSSVSDIDTGGEEWNIGDDDTPGSNSFNGSIDELMMFNISLTSSQISDLYNNQSARFKPQGVHRLRAINSTDTDTWDGSGGYSNVNLTTNISEEFGSSIEARVGMINISVDPEGLIYYFPFEFGALDISGNNRDGTLTGGIFFNETNGQNGSDAFSFDGVDDLIDVPGYNWTNQTEITVCAWARNNLAEPGASDQIMSQGYAGGHRIYKLVHPNNQNVEFYVRNAQGSEVYGRFVNGVIDTKWHHYCGRLNVTTVSVFVDTVEGGTSNLFSGQMEDGFGTEWYQKATIGSDYSGEDTPDDLWNGTIDTVMVFNRSLSDAEIINLFNNQSLAHNVPYYTNTVNITDNVNMTFNISTDADFIFPEYNFYASDLDNPFYSPIIHFDESYHIYNVSEAGAPTDDSPVSILSMPLNGNITLPGVIEFECNATDDNALLNVTLNIWNATGNASIATNTTTWNGTTNTTKFNHTLTDEDWYVWNCEVYDNASQGSWGASNFTLNITTPAVADNEYPVFSSYTETPSEPTTYGDSTTFEFNTTLLSTNGSVQLEFDGTNYSASNFTWEIFNYTFMNLSAGNYSYHWNAWGNGTDKNYNNSNTFYYNITTAIPEGNLTNSTNLSVTYPTEIIVGLEESNLGDSGVTYIVYRDNVSISTGETITLGAGTYIYLLNTTGGTNWSGNSSMDNFTHVVSQASSLLNLTIDDDEANKTIATGTSINLNCTIVNGDPNGYIRMEQEGTIINNGTSPIGNLTTFNTIQEENITCYYEGTGNYTLSTQTWFVNVTDAVNPNVTIVEPANQTYTTTTIEFNVTALDTSPIDSCLYSLNEGVNNFSMSNATATMWNSTNTTMAQGSHTVNYYCNDTSNNLNNTENVTFFIDSIFPVPTITFPQNTSYAVDVTQFNFTYVETNPETCWYSRNLGITNLSEQACTSNFTGVTSVEGSNNWILYINDTLGNQNTTNITFFKDTTDPATTFVSPTEASGTTFARNATFVNVSITESNIDTITFSLSNATTIINITNFTDGTSEINFTNLPDDIYFFNVTVNDTLGNTNFTETRNQTLDNGFPLIQFVNETIENGSVLNQNEIWANVTASNGVSGIDTINTTIWDSSGNHVSSNTSTTSPHFTNFTGLSPGVYYINATVNDSANNINQTETRQIRLITDVSVIHAEFESGEEVFNSATYIPIINDTFNLTTASHLTFKGVAAIRKQTGSSSIVSMRLIVNDIVLFDQVIRTVDNLQDRGVFTLPVNDTIGTPGVNSLIVEVLEVGAGSVNISSLEVHLETNETKLTQYPHEDLGTTTSFSSASIINIANFTFDKNEFNSTTHVDITHKAAATGETTPTCYLQNNVTQERSPTYMRYLSSASDSGSLGITFISNFTTRDTETWQVWCSNDNGETVTNNLTFYSIGLVDDEGNTINYFQNTTSFTGLTGTSNLISSINHTALNGTIIELQSTSMIQSSSGAQVADNSPRIYVNSTQISELNCSESYQRSLSSNLDIGTIKFYVDCYNMTVGETYTFNVYADVSGANTLNILNQSFSGYEIFDLDKATGIVAPTVIITNPATDSNNSGVMIINASVSDSSNVGWISKVSFLNSDLSLNQSILNEASHLNTTNTSFDTTSISDGNYILEWNVTGGGGTNFDLENITIDNTAPIITIYDPQNITYGKVSIPLNVSADEAVATWEYSLDNGGTNTTFTPNDTITASVGSNLLFVYANDTQGNIGVANVTFFVDLANPSVNIVFPIQSTNYSVDITELNYTYIEGGNPIDSCWYSVDNGLTNISEQTAGINFTSVTSNAGTNNWTVYCNDSIDAQGSDSVVFWKDIIFPDINITSPLNDTNTTDTGINVIYTFTEMNPNNCWYTNDTGANNNTITCGDNLTSEVWDQGANVVEININDTSGNLNFSSVTFNVDSINPFINITNPLNGTLTSDTGIDINYSVSDTNLDACWYTNDTGASNNTIGGCANLTTLTWDEGENIVRIYANDTFGNMNSSSVNFTVDTGAPIVSITFPTNITYVVDVTALNYTATNGGSPIDSCWYSLDLGANNSSRQDVGINWTGLSSDQGSNNWTMYCNDSVNNVGLDSVTFFKDTIFPNINITFPTNLSNTTNTQLDINYTFSNVNEDSCWWTNDTGVSNNTLANCGVNVTGQTWDEGLNTIIIYINDTGNNQNSSSVTFRLDTTPPHFFGIMNQTLDNETALSYVVPATDDGVGLESFIINWTDTFNMSITSGLLTNDTQLNITSYIINVTVNDTLGNQNSTLLKITVTAVLGDNQRNIFEVLNDITEMVVGYIDNFGNLFLGGNITKETPGGADIECVIESGGQCLWGFNSTCSFQYSPDGTNITTVCN